MAYLPAIIAVVGAGVSAASSISSAHYQAAVARNNQTIAKQNADFARQKGQAEEQAKRQQTAQVQGTARAIAGASGLDPNTDDPLRTTQDVARLGELDALTIRSNASREAYGYESQSRGFGAQADMDIGAGNLDAFSSIMGGASSVSDKWLTYKQHGV